MSTEAEYKEKKFTMVVYRINETEFSPIFKFNIRKAKAVRCEMDRLQVDLLMT